MIVVDTSALLAVVLNEPDSAIFLSAVARSPAAILPAPAYVEASLKIIARGGALTLLDMAIRELRITIEAFGAEHARAASEARVRYGRGKDGLNFGDCMVYAVAKLAGAPLLYKGRDFALTDIEPAHPATP